MKKKIISLLLALCMLVALGLTGCTPTEPSANNPGSSNNPGGPDGPGGNDPFEEEPAEISVILWANGTPPTSEAMALVNEKLNEITIPEINVKVNVQIWDVGTYIGTSATAVGAGDDIDLMCTFPAAAPHFSSMSVQNMLLPLNDLLDEYCSDIMELIPEGWWATTTQNGEILGVPIYANKANTLRLFVVKEWFDELGLNAEDIKTVDDIHEMLLAFHAKHPDKICLSGDNMSTAFTYPGFDFVTSSYYDVLGDNSGIVIGVPFDANGNTDYKVVSHFESDAFNTMRKALQTWYNEGLIDKDLFSYEGNGMPLAVNADAFSEMEAQTPTMATNFATRTLHEALRIDMLPGVVSTGDVIQMTWALPTSCDEPEAAAKFMNMLYSNADIYNLICFGVEGVHYVMNADGQMEMPEGMAPDSSPYYPNCYNFVGNTTLSNTWAGSDPTLPQQEKQAIQESVNSPLLGFTFDSSSVSDQFARLISIAHDQYSPFIVTGAASDAQYEEFINKLYENGLQEVMDEAQRQVDEWVAANK